MPKNTIITAVGALLALGLSLQSQAAEPMQSNPQNLEKCYGIAKKGMNDCPSSINSCAGQSKVDRDKYNWIALPKGTCEKIVGGSTTPPPPPKK